MASWSPSDAINAYMNTLQLCKDYYHNLEDASEVVEPKCMEYISALAAGNRARLMVDVESGGAMNPFVLALAAAARQTGGRLVCVRHEEADAVELRAEIERFDLGDVVECEAAVRGLAAIERLESVDFVVVDHTLAECGELVAAVDANPRGAVVVVSNLFKGAWGARTSPAASSSYGQLVKWKERGAVRSVVLPFGGGMEVTRFGRRADGKWNGRSHASAGKKRSGRKFVVYYEEENSSNMVKLIN